MSKPIRINVGVSATGRKLVQRAVKIIDEFAIMANDFAQMDQIKTADGKLTTRTNNTDGTLTLDAGHAIPTGALIDISFSGGSRTAVVVGTVNGVDVPISGGSGNNLPADESDVTVTHYNAIAKEYQTVLDDGTTVSADVGKVLYDELNSALGNSAALKQFCAKIRQ